MVVFELDLWENSSCDMLLIWKNKILKLRKTMLIQWIFSRVDSSQKCNCGDDKLFVTWHKKSGAQVAFLQNKAQRLVSHISKSPQQTTQETGRTWSLNKTSLDLHDTFITVKVHGIEWSMISFPVQTTTSASPALSSDCMSPT